MYNTGKILVLAYPDTFVKHSSERFCKFLPYLGLGTKTHIKAGHAALILIENKTGKGFYYDFGRYVTPPGYGRVRGANTDIELQLPFLAQLNRKNELVNLDDFFRWLDKNPDKTHGSGRLISSVCDEIDYEKAQSYIINLQQKECISYGAFTKNGTNCSRFVMQTLLNACSNTRIKNALKTLKRFTPSTVGVVEKATTKNMYEVFNGSISVYKRSALRENLINYFDKKITTHPHSLLKKPTQKSQLLPGTGSSAWFELIAHYEYKKLTRIKRYNERGIADFDGIFKTPEGFDASQPYVFTYPSHCQKCTVLQQGNVFVFKFLKYSDVYTQQKNAVSA